jgi:hypothetical protein
MNRAVGLLAGFLATTASLVTTIEANAQQFIPRSKNINHTYSGVDRCGAQQNLVEAESGAKNHVSNISSQLNMPVFLVNHRIINEATRRWKETGRFGEVKGRKCQTTMTIKVNYQIQLPNSK